jgi:hypothetical protein
MLNTKYRLLGFLAILIFAVVSLAVITKNKKQPEGIIIFTAVPVNHDVNAKFPEGAKIFSLDKVGENPVLLTQKFYSSRSPEVSFDGLKMLFTTQAKKGDVWQIWEMDLPSSEAKQITNRESNCTDPAYLPNGQIVFSSPTLKLKKLPGIIALFTIEKDGTNEKQITYHPNNDQNPTVLGDGRILTNSYRVYPDVGRNHQLVLRPDGTKAELYYRPKGGNELISRGWETEDGHYVYIEKPQAGAGRVIIINQNRPLDSETDISSPYPGEFHSVFPIQNDEYLVSYQEDYEQKYKLYLMEIKGSSTLDLLYASNDYHIIEPVVVKIRTKPKNLPSRIVESDENGTILCMDADLSQDMSSDVTLSTKTFAVEVLGINNSLGKVPVAADGSFYIEVPSNTPIRFQTYNESEQMIRGPSDWIWVRPKERRGCIGCHEDKELTPENRVPLAVGKQIVNLTTNTDRPNSE